MSLDLTFLVSKQVICAKIFVDMEGLRIVILDLGLSPDVIITYGMVTGHAIIILVRGDDSENQISTGMNVRLSSRSKAHRKPINIRLFLIYRRGLWC